MNTDPIADLLNRIRNAYKADISVITIPYSKIKEEILKIFVARNYLGSYKVRGEGKEKVFEVTLGAPDHTLTIKRVSKPGQRIYMKHKNLKPVLQGLGVSIVSTPKGIMTNIEAHKQKLGGEIVCEVY